MIYTSDDKINHIVHDIVRVKSNRVNVTDRYKCIDPLTAPPIPYDDGKINYEQYYLGEPKVACDETLIRNSIAFYPFCVVGPPDIVRSFLIDIVANDFIDNYSSKDSISIKRLLINKRFIPQTKQNTKEHAQLKYKIFRGGREIYDMNASCSYGFWTQWFVDNDNSTCDDIPNYNEDQICMQFYCPKRKMVTKFTIF